MSSKTVSRWCESGRIPAMAKTYGDKTTYLISPQALEFLIREQVSQQAEKKAEKLSEKAHKTYVQAWISALSKGLLTGRAYSPRTVKLYEDYADEFFKRHGQLSADTLESSLGCIPAKSISKRQNFYKALVCLGKYLIKQRALGEDFLLTVKTLSPKRHLPPKRHSITTEQMKSILQGCQTLEDKLLIQLLASTGLRNAEFCALRVNDIDLEQGTLLVRCGKGGKQRKVGITGTATALLIEYLATCKRSGEAHLLLNLKGQPMDIHGLYQRVERIGRQVNVTLSPHVLRRAFVTHNANKGRPLQMLQRACGHSDVKTTMSYCRTTENEVIEAMKGWD